MTTYFAKKNAIVDEKGKQIAVVLMTNCTQKTAALIAAAGVLALNQQERLKAGVIVSTRRKEATS